MPGISLPRLCLLLSFHLGKCSRKKPEAVPLHGKAEQSTLGWGISCTHDFGLISSNWFSSGESLKFFREFFELNSSWCSILPKNSTKKCWFVLLLPCCKFIFFPLEWSKSGCWRPPALPLFEKSWLFQGWYCCCSWLLDSSLLPSTRAQGILHLARKEKETGAQDGLMLAVAPTLH